MTLRQRLEELERTLEAELDTESRQQRVGQIRQRVERLEEACAALDAISSPVRELASHGYLDDVPGPELGSLAKKLHRSMTATSDPWAIDTEEGETLVKALDHLANQLAQSVAVAWSNVKYEHLPAETGADELLDLLPDQVEGVEALRMEREKLQSRLTVLLERNRPQPGDVRSLFEASSELKGVRERELQLLPPGRVREFLRDVHSRQGAPLADAFDDEVRSFLNQSGLEGTYRVKPA